MNRRFPAGVTVTIHRYQAGMRGALEKVSEHTIPGVGVSRPNTEAGTFPVEVAESSRQIQVRDIDADVRSGDYLTFNAGHRLSGTWWRVRGDVLDFENPLTGWQAGLTFRIEKDFEPEVAS